MALVTTARIKRLFPRARADLVAAIVDHWAEAEAVGLTSPRRVAYFFGQIGVETGGLTAIEENLNYSARRLAEVWPNRFPSLAAAQPFANNPEALANKTYGDRLGNTRPGDGWRYRGSGMMQTTGRDNFRALGYEANPEALRAPVTAFRAALAEWAKRRCNEFADEDDLRGLRKIINGGTHGLADAKAYTIRAKTIFAPRAAGIMAAAEIDDDASSAAPAAPSPPPEEPAREEPASAPSMMTSKTGAAAITTTLAGASAAISPLIDAAGQATEAGADAWGLAQRLGPWLLLAAVICAGGAYIWFRHRAYKAEIAAAGGRRP